MTMRRYHANTQLVLHAARTLLSVPGLWSQTLPDGDSDDTQGAADAEGNIVRPHASSAVRWTTIGAIWKAGRGRSPQARLDACTVLDIIVKQDFEAWSETEGRTLQEVLNAFDSAFTYITVAPFTQETV